LLASLPFFFFSFFLFLLRFSLGAALIDFVFNSHAFENAEEIGSSFFSHPLCKALREWLHEGNGNFVDLETFFSRMTPFAFGKMLSKCFKETQTRSLWQVIQMLHLQEDATFLVDVLNQPDLLESTHFQLLVFLEIVAGTIPNFDYQKCSNTFISSVLKAMIEVTSGDQFVLLLSCPDTVFVFFFLHIPTTTEILSSFGSVEQVAASGGI
jgi:hypothetical protein